MFQRRANNLFVVFFERRGRNYWKRGVYCHPRVPPLVFLLQDSAGGDSWGKKDMKMIRYSIAGIYSSVGYVAE